MKKIVFIIMVLFIGVSVQAQKVDESAVPISTRKAFAKMYPNVKIFKWEQNGVDFEANFKEDDIQQSATYDPDGVFIRLEKLIAFTAFPQGITDYMAKNLPGKKVKEASQITDAAGGITYEVEIKEVDYIFDAKGNFLKKEDDK
jgi:hypothetical protein